MLSMSPIEKKYILQLFQTKKHFPRFLHEKVINRFSVKRRSARYTLWKEDIKQIFYGMIFNNFLSADLK